MFAFAKQSPSNPPALVENLGRYFKGGEPAGPFDVPKEAAQGWIEQSNPSGKSNADVLMRYLGWVLEGSSEALQSAS